MRYIKGVESKWKEAGEELGKVEGEETIIRMYYVRKIFSIKGKSLEKEWNHTNVS